MDCLYVLQALNIVSLREYSAKIIAQSIHRVLNKMTIFTVNNSDNYKVVIFRVVVRCKMM